MKERAKKSLILIAVGIAINVVLASIKMYVGLSVNSLVIMLDATNSFLDIITGIVTLVVFVMLLVPRSESAPYGYGRGEYLAGFVVAVTAVVMGGLFFIRSINRLAMPEPVYFGWQNCVLIAVCVPLKLAMGLGYYFANKKIKSKALRAIMLDSFLDTAITTTSLVSFAISANVDYAVDAIFGIVMSIVIIVVAIKMVVDNVKAIVIGDGSIEERDAVEQACKARGVEYRNLTFHDYGYGSRVGSVRVDCSKDTTNALHDEILASVGADIDFIVEVSLDKDECDKNSN